MFTEMGSPSSGEQSCGGEEPPGPRACAPGVPTWTQRLLASVPSAPDYIQRYGDPISGALV